MGRKEVSLLAAVIFVVGMWERLGLRSESQAYEAVVKYYKDFFELFGGSDGEAPRRLGR